MLEGRVAVVTAAGGVGIGSSIARLLAEHGATVAVTDKSGQRAGEVADQINATGGRASGWGLDVTKSEDVRSVFDRIAEAHGPVDTLVNNAGVSIPSPVATMSEELFTKVVDVSLKGTFLCTRAVLPGMQAARFGRIVNISSYVAFAGSPDLAHYGAAKAGVVGFTRSLALEVGHHGIAINAIAPGIILNEHLDANRDQFSPEIRERLDRGTPIGRHGRPEDIAHAVLYLVGARDGFVTGVTLPVNGGLYLS